MRLPWGWLSYNGHLKRADQLHNNTWQAYHIGPAGYINQGAQLFT